MRTALLAALLATAPLAAHADDFIEAELIAVRDLKVGLGGAELTAVLGVTQNRGLPTRLRSLDYTLTINDHVLATGSSEEKVRLRRGEVVEVPFTVRSEATAMGPILEALSAGGVRVEVAGEARLCVLLFPRKVEFDEAVMELSGR